MKACGEHVIPESTCTIRLCLWKQESPDFRQGSVQTDSIWTILNDTPKKQIELK